MEVCMGHWFDDFHDDLPWRKTPAKIGGTWYTPKGDRIENPHAYFAAVNKRGRFWEGDTGWPDPAEKRRKKRRKK
jgi:hypothetical protein